MKRGKKIDSTPTDNWSLLIGPTPHKIFVWDLTGVYLDCVYPNPQHGHFLQGTALIGKKLTEVFAHDIATEILSVIRSVLKTKKPTHRTIHFHTRKNTFHSHIRFFPFSNVVVGFVVDTLVKKRGRPTKNQTAKDKILLDNDVMDNSLSTREQEIIQWIHHGKTNKQIGSAAQYI